MFTRTIIAIYLPVLFTLVCLLLGMVSLLFLLPAFLGACDAIARYKDYLAANNCYTMQTIKKLKHSACQRNAAIAALGDYARRVYYGMGYRWYHLLPDGTFSIKRNPYFKLNFYKRLMGVQ